MEFAAHIKEEKIQTVSEHCLNTAELCERYAASFGCCNIGKIQGLLHDAGKLTEEFNDYIRGISNVSRGSIDHSYSGARYLDEISQNTSYHKMACLAARTIISHHGIHDWVDDNYHDYYNERISKSKGYDEVRSNLHMIAEEAELSELLEKAGDEYLALKNDITKLSKGRKKGKEEYAFYLGMLERILQSVLIDADRSDTAHFMNGTPLSSDTDVSALWAAMDERMNEKLGGFADKTDRISLQRKNISDRCAAFAKNEVKVCRMIVPTGGGKTLSSLRFAIKYCMEHDMERIIYTAPFMSILEQNSDEIRKISGDEFFTEHHSNALAELDPETESNEYEEYELHTERWDSPVIATTMVQFLNTLFSGKSSSIRRMHRLSKAVIIIDEVQSIPVKCVNMFNLAVNFLTNICGAVVVLCSATQPVNEETDYPMVIDEKCSMTGDYKEDFEVFRRTDIIPHIDPYGYSYEETAEFCMEKFHDAGNLLAIVNTKSAALKLYSLISERCGNDTEVIHLSTNMCPQHRKDRINCIRKLLHEQKHVICITTQLIEAGVDISFRCVVRSMAGLDSAAQAAGRCNRHGEAGKVCPVYIIKLKEERLGSLKDIVFAQNISLQMMDSGRYSDYQSAETISDYFRMLFRQRKGELSYNTYDKETLLGYLSLNKNRREVSPKTSDQYGSQAFRTAGSLFEVIDSNTKDIIVPYNEEARELIVRLEREKKNVNPILRKLQKYTVSVYSGTERKLSENHSFRVLDCGAAVLDGEYYDDVVGIKLEGAEREVLLF